MKREYLEGLTVGEGVKLTKEVIDGIMGENGKDIETAKAKFADYDVIKTQLTEANKTVESFKDLDVDGIKKTAEDWEKKAKQAEIDSAAKVAELQADTAIKDLLGGYKFTSTLARDAVATKIKAAGLKMDGGKLLGADDLIKNIQTEDAGAFAADGKPPHIIDQTQGGGGGGEVKSLRDALTERYNAK